MCLCPQKQGLGHRHLSVLRAQHGMGSKTEAGCVCAVRRWCWPCLVPLVGASLKPPALLTPPAPDIQAISWVLEHIWLVSASALGFLPLEALLWDLPITGSFVVFRSQLKLTSDTAFLTAYAKKLLFHALVTSQHNTLSYFLVTLTTPWNCGHVLICFYIVLVIYCPNPIRRNYLVHQGIPSASAMFGS